MIGFHCSHELYSPSQLLRLVAKAETAGFDTASCSDHFNPWSDGGQSGYAWSWLGSALERTSLDFGCVCAPGQRYHPAIVAQKCATLAEMYPGRFWVALGTGQNLNEHITGTGWPSKETRKQRLEQSVDIMRRLWAGETVTTHGLVRCEKAKLYSLPEKPPLIFGAAITDDSARWVGSWADGLLTVGKSTINAKKTIQAFRDGGGHGKPMRVQSAVAFAPTEEEATREADKRWGHAGIGIAEQQDIETPWDFDNAAREHTRKETHDLLRVSCSIQQHIDWIRTDLELGFEAVYLHHVGGQMESFIETFAREVLPQCSLNPTR